MPQEATTGQQMAATVLEGAGHIEAYLILSSIDIELLKFRKRSAKKYCESLLQGLPQVQTFFDAFDRGGTMAVRDLADKSQTIPGNVWYFDNQTDFEQELDGIYKRVPPSQRRYIAYDHGFYDKLANILLWLE